MQIMSNHTRAAAIASDTNTDTSKSTSKDASNAMVNEQTFLQLLVSQIKNQDPLSPTDSMQFVSQLAQFSSLEQLIGIHESLNTLNTQFAVATTTTNPPPGNSQ